MLVCDTRPFFVALHAFTGYKVLPLPPGSWHSPGVWVRSAIVLICPSSFIRLLAGGIAGLVGNPGGSCTTITRILCRLTRAPIYAEIIMVCFPWGFHDFCRLTASVGSLARRYG